MSTQQEFLRGADATLGLTQKELATRMCAPWETFRKWLMPSESGSYREMPEIVWQLVGIARFATMSDSSFIAPLNSFKKHQERLARYQRRMSRKVKFSNNWKKEKNQSSKGSHLYR